jgi:hypothetical protein
MRFSVSGDLNWDGMSVQTTGTRVEFRDTAAEAVAEARR